MTLIKDVGLDLEDIRGSREVRRTVTDPPAWVEAADPLTQRRARAIGAAVLAAGLLAAYAAGSIGSLFVSAGIAVGLEYLSMIDAGPREETVTIEKPGMRDKEPHELLKLHNEQEQMRSEARQEEFEGVR